MSNISTPPSPPRLPPAPTTTNGIHNTPAPTTNGIHNSRAPIPTPTPTTPTTTKSTTPDPTADIPWPTIYDFNTDPIPHIIWSVDPPTPGKDPEKYMQYPASVIERHPWLLEDSDDDDDEGEEEEEEKVAGGGGVNGGVNGDPSTFVKS
ncbi:hypothetical protein L873DRAFT_1845313 [Choiromyces venosus 120613-1]|uniref:Uncharacterized protein n=1 Tax=Choiromyces venosus 120613-1 TaxID=1336337 RepID=A0A3N4JHR7_9PEZI|nr:hypothetical protein L873DRAFT_1845313 [Choiromyces venosus 120613-1]